MAVNKNNAGNYQHKIELQRRTQVQNVYGELVDDWETARRPYAWFRAARGDEVLTGDKLDAGAVTTLRIRRIKSLDPSYRIRYGERIFEIVAVTDVDESHHFQDLTARELVPIEAINPNA